jgi:hypothetical protein
MPYWPYDHGGGGGDQSAAERVASILAYQFLRDGKYSAAHGPVEVRSLLRAAGAAASGEKEPDIGEGFGNIAVQSVGFEQGVKDPKVHIYLTRSSATLIKSLPKEIDDIPVRAHRMGPITVRPEAAASATNHGHLFERGSRICCGSSCAPTSENCSGTVGALVKRRGSAQLSFVEQPRVRRLQPCSLWSTNSRSQQR